MFHRVFDGELQFYLLPDPQLWKEPVPLLSGAQIYGARASRRSIEELKKDIQRAKVIYDLVTELLFDKTSL